MRVLRIQTSIQGEKSVTRYLGDEVISLLPSDAEVKTYDLAKTPMPYFDFRTVSSQDSAIGDLFASDILLIEAPMYNFTVPAVLKSWIDQVCVSGKTFRYTENGPEGLLSHLKVVVVGSQGGHHPQNHHTDYLRDLWRFLGTDPLIVCASGVSMPSSDISIAEATRDIGEKVPSYLF